jgi:Zn-dependent protease
MDSRSSIIYLGLPLGTLFGTRIRVSLWFPLLVVVCLQRMELPVALAVSAILFVSVLIHEFAHIVTARLTGGEGNEILIWPLGGLAFTRPAHTVSSEFLTALAGPVSNLLLWLGALATMQALKYPVPVATHNLLTLPGVVVKGAVLQDVLILTASINFKLMCLNLLPAIPLDGGQMVYSFAKTRWESVPARLHVLQLGMFISFVLAIAGVIFTDTFPLLLAFMVMVYNLHEYYITMIASQFGDPFGEGEEFGGGYGAAEEASRQPGMIARWRQKREDQRRQKAELERAETEQKLDELLDKVHREGMNALSPTEKRFLSQASARYRSQEH